MVPEKSLLSPSLLEETDPSLTFGLGAQALRLAISAQRDRALAYAGSGVAALAASFLGVLRLHSGAGLALLALGLGSALVFAGQARRRFRITGRVDPAVTRWIVFDILVITAAIPMTGGISSPWWIWYLACAGCAALHKGRRFAIGGAMATALLYLGVLVASGEITGFGHNLFLAVSRLVFMGGASVVLLSNTLNLRQSLATVRRLHREAEVRAKDFARLNGELQAMADLLVDIRSTDRLTGLRPPPYFQEKIAVEEADVSPLPTGERRLKGLSTGAGFLLFGLDHLDLLKSIHGESAGDLALQHVTELLLGHTRAEDTVVRWGESELLTFLPRIASDQIPAVAEKIRTALRSRTFKLGTQKATALSVSVGTSFLAPAEQSRKSAWWEGIAAAEAALAATQKVA